MRRFSWWIAGSLALVALGCSSNGSNNPLAPPSNSGQTRIPGTSSSPIAAAVGIGGVAVDGDNTTSAIGIYKVDVDPKTMSATSHLVETRAGQKDSDLYLLSIGNFMTASSFHIDSLAVNGVTGNLDMTYTVTHPFPSCSNPTGVPNGSTNREDLGITGLVLWTPDVASATGNTFFDSGTSSVIANTSLITNADAYYAPAGLLTVTGATANTFPYKVLVDETANGGAGSRVGVSNGNNVTGNYGTDGWTLAELGAAAPYDKWTGYGVLHQGQASQNLVSFSSSGLGTAGATFTINAVVIAKYNDPRDGATPALKKANRLPKATGNGLLYREPHGSLDVEKISYDGATGAGFNPNAASTSTLYFHVTDWDARATESASADLSTDTTLTNVAQGESGLPGFSVCIPGVLSNTSTDAGPTSQVSFTPATDVVDDDSAYGGDVTSDSGVEGDALFYCKAVNKTSTGPGQVPGTYVGLAQATDAEEASAGGQIAIPLDGTLLTPLASNKPHNISYQAFKVDMFPVNTAPTATVTPPPAAILSATGLGYFKVTINDPDGYQTKTIQFDWDNDGDFTDPGEGAQTITAANQVVVSPIAYNNETSATANATAPVPFKYTDGIVAPIAGTANLTIGPNQAPAVHGTIKATFASNNFTVDDNGGSYGATDPEGDTLAYLVKSGITPNGPFPSAAGQAALPISGIGPFNSFPGPDTLTLYARDAFHGNTSTVGLDDATPTTTSGFIPCSVAGAYAGNNIVTMLPSGYYGTYTVNAPGESGKSLDAALDPSTAVSPGGGTIIQPVTATKDFYVMTQAGYGTSPSIAAISNFGASLTKRAGQIEFDPAGRVVFSTVSTSYSGGDTGGPAQMYAATGADTGFNFFDWGGSGVATSFTNVSTGSNRSIALAMDLSGTVYQIDQNHILHRYFRATGYAEDTTSPWPANESTILGNPAGVGAANVKVVDFVFNARGGNFLVLEQTQGAYPNLQLVRIECDTTTTPTVAGNPNPKTGIDCGINNTTQSFATDIFLDQWSTTGAVLANQGEAQIICNGYQTNNSPIFNTNLVNTTNWCINCICTCYGFSHFVVNTLNCPAGPDPSFGSNGIFQHPGTFATNWQ